MTRLPRRPTWLYRTGAQITTADGIFEVIVTGAADSIWRQWAPVRKPSESKPEPVVDRLKPRFGHPITSWWRWFAWYPVNTVDRGYVWLRLIHRRRIAKYSYLDGGADFWFQHAVATEV